MNQDAVNILIRSLKCLQDSSDYSDLKIFCGDQVFTVHKAIVCPRSEFFSKACSWGKDGQPKSEIDLQDDDPKILKLMIDYLYQLDYDDLPILETASVNDAAEPVVEEPVIEEPVIEEPVIEEPVPVDDWGFGISSKSSLKKKKKSRMLPTRAMSDEEPTYEPIFSATRARLHDLAPGTDADRIVVNTHMYALADKYGIEDLKRLAQTKFTYAAEQSWRSEAFVQASRLAFDNTPSSDLGLRSVIISTLRNHRELLDYEEVQELLDSGNGIAWQLVKVLLGRQ